MTEQKSKITDGIVISEQEKNIQKFQSFPWNHILIYYNIIILYFNILIILIY